MCVHNKNALTRLNNCLILFRYLFIFLSLTQTGSHTGFQQKAKSKSISRTKKRLLVNWPSCVRLVIVAGEWRTYEYKNTRTPAHARNICTKHIFTCAWRVCKSCLCSSDCFPCSVMNNFTNRNTHSGNLLKVSLSPQPATAISRRMLSPKRESIVHLFVFITHSVSRANERCSKNEQVTDRFRGDYVPCAARTFVSSLGLCKQIQVHTYAL